MGKWYHRLHEEKENLAELGDHFFQKADNGIKDRMLKRMELREKFIEEAVEIHLKTLRYETGDSFDESVGISKNLSLKDKLKILTLNQEIIDQSKQKGKTLRMVGVNQSYYMFDAHQYQDHKLMLGLIMQKMDLDDTNNSKQPLVAQNDEEAIKILIRNNNTGLGM